jgi:hypothetical protein
MDDLGVVPGRFAALPQKTGGGVPVLTMGRDFRVGVVPGRFAALPQKTGGGVPVLAMRRDFRLVAMPRVLRVAMPRVEMSSGCLFAPGWPRDEAFSMAGQPVRMRRPRSS